MDAEQGFLRERSANVTAGVQNSEKPTANAAPHRTPRTRIAHEPSNVTRQPEHPRIHLINIPSSALCYTVQDL